MSGGLPTFGIPKPSLRGRMDPARRLGILQGEGRALRLIGEIDLASAHLLKEEIDELLASRGDVSLDMRSVSFMDATGAHVLLDALERLNPDRLLIIAPPRLVRRLLNLTGLTERPNLVLEPGPGAP
jgi:anti-anti-sigma factor